MIAFAFSVSLLSLNPQHLLVLFFWVIKHQKHPLISLWFCKSPFSWFFAPGFVGFIKMSAGLSPWLETQGNPLPDSFTLSAETRLLVLVGLRSAVAGCWPEASPGSEAPLVSGFRPALVCVTSRSCFGNLYFLFHHQWRKLCFHCVIGSGSPGLLHFINLVTGWLIISLYLQNPFYQINANHRCDISSYSQSQSEGRKFGGLFRILSTPYPL